MSGSHNTHARLAPSSASRWARCTASTAYIAANQHRIPEDKGSIYAQEGTDAHDWAEKVLLGEITLADVPDEFRPHIKVYVDHCNALVAEHGGTSFVEVVVPLFYSPGDTGTCDFALISNNRVTIRDYKHGAGVMVEAEHNSQLAIYGLSLLFHLQESDPDLYYFDDNTICDFGIVQPRYHGEEPIRTWITTLGELRTFIQRMRATAESIRANTDDLTFAPSEGACRWCPAKAFCEARIAWLAEPLGNAEILSNLPDLTKDERKLAPKDRVDIRHTGNDDTLVAVHANAKNIRAWLDDIEEYLTDRATSGNPAPGTKLVTGRQGNRKWADEFEADKLLKGKLSADERYVKKLITPAQAETLLSLDEQSTRFRNRFTALVSRSDGRPVLALADDPRPAITTGLDDLPSFDDDLD